MLNSLNLLERKHLHHLHYLLIPLSYMICKVSYIVLQQHKAVHKSHRPFLVPSLLRITGYECNARRGCLFWKTECSDMQLFFCSLQLSNNIASFAVKTPRTLDSFCLTSSRQFFGILSGSFDPVHPVILSFTDDLRFLENRGLTVGASSSSSKIHVFCPQVISADERQSFSLSWAGACCLLCTFLVKGASNCLLPSLIPKAVVHRRFQVDFFYHVLGCCSS